MMIFPVDSVLLFLSCSVMSARLKGGKKTVINMGEYGDDFLYAIVVLHRECGSSGKTNKLIFAWCDVFHMFAFLSPQHISCVCVLLAYCVLHLYVGAVDCLTFVSFTFDCLRYHGLEYTRYINPFIRLMM